MPEGVMPAAIRFRPENVRDSINIRKNCADDAPLAQIAVGTANIPQGPSQRCVRFEVHKGTLPQGPLRERINRLRDNSSFANVRQLPGYD